MDKVTVENFDEMIVKQELKDLLSSYAHPNEYLNELGHTYLSYVQWKRQKHGKPLKYICRAINQAIEGKPITITF
jgi:hypothetical protein